MRVMVVTDNEFLYNNIKALVSKNEFSSVQFDFYFSMNNSDFRLKYFKSDFKPIDIKIDEDLIIDNYNLVLSVHCKQLFPQKIVNQVRCINVHPGLNPFNRGWFPQVFSILNKLPVGVTIHEMDDQLDHGPIIAQRELKIFPWETSYDVYKRIQQIEVEMLEVHLVNILNGNYKLIYPANEGNINFKKDFAELCKIDLMKITTYGEAIDYFRAMSFSGYNNAYFFDENGNKIYVNIILQFSESVK